MRDAFEYDALYVQYLPEWGIYFVYDSIAGGFVGRVCLVDGPGWVLDAVAMTFMWSEMQSIADLLHDLNETLEEGE